MDATAFFDIADTDALGPDTLNFFTPLRVVEADDEDPNRLPETRHGSFEEYSALIPTSDGVPLNFDWFPFQAPYPKSTAGEGLPGLYSDEVANARSVVAVKSTQVGACLDPETKVLTDDLRWVRIDDIHAGQGLVAVDESRVEGHGKARKFRRAVCEARRDVRQPAFRLVLEDGRELIATANHRFLARRAKLRPGEMYWRPESSGQARRIRGHWRPAPQHESNRFPWTQQRWHEVGEMEPGRFQIRAVLDGTWGEPTYEDGWAGGVLDGEASWGTGAGGSLVFTQRPGPVLDRYIAWLTARGINYRVEMTTSTLGHRPVARVHTQCQADLMKMIGLARTSRWSPGSCWWEGKTLPKKGAAPSTHWVTVVAIEPLGVRRMVDLQTSEKTYVAEGLVSHNSEWTIRGTIRQVDEFGSTAIYVFPTDDAVTEFGRERFEPMIRASVYLQSRILPRYIGNAHQKMIGEGILSLRGSVQRQTNKRAAKGQSTAAQYVVFDEYNDLDQRTVSQMERRTSGAAQIGKTARFRRIGVPTVDGAGISAHFDSSDRRRWHVHCTGCGEEQTITWGQNMRWTTRSAGDEVCRPGSDVYANTEDVTRAWRACRACEAELDVANGRWLAEDPEAETIGFHISRLIVPNTDLAEIVRNSRKREAHEVEAFHQNDLGEPFTDAETGLPRDVVARLINQGRSMVESLAKGPVVTMGVDVASERDLHYRISVLVTDDPDDPLSDTKRVCLRTGRAEDFAALDVLMEDFNVWLCAIDSLPERRSARDFSSRFPGRVVLVRYDDSVEGQSVVYDESKNIASVHRTDTLDAAISAIRERRNVLPLDAPPHYIDHLAALRRARFRDARGRTFYRYITVGTGDESGTDDYMHADAYDLVAKDLMSMVDLSEQIEDARRGDVVHGGMDEPFKLSDDYHEFGEGE